MMRTIGTFIAALCFLAVTIGYLVAGQGPFRLLVVLITGALFIFNAVMSWRSFQQRKSK